MKISALPAAAALTGAELVPVVQGGITYQTTTQDIADLASGGAGSAGTATLGDTISIGDFVWGGTINCVLFVDASGNVADDGSFTYNSGTQTLSSTNFTVSNTLALLAAGTLNFNGAGGGINFDATTGNLIGISSLQKFAFWGGSPAAQQVLATGALHTVDDVITFLQSLGLCRQA